MLLCRVRGPVWACAARGFWRSQIRYSSFYTPSLRRNRVPFINFKTTCRKSIASPTLTTAFTLHKQLELTKSLKSYPQLTWKGRTIRQLSCHRINTAGRNVVGRICSSARGGRHIQRLRFVDFKRGRKDIHATVLRIEYDPCRTSHLALIQYEDGVLSYILAPLSIRPGDRIIASAHANITPGNCLPLRNIPVGSIVHNIEVRPGAGGQFVRAAGCHAVLLSKGSHFATIKLKSSEIRNFSLECWATIGQLSNPEAVNKVLGKAGANRWRGRRPRVRGVAMNPVDHPHGGGTKAKHSKRPPVTKYGILCDGFKTRCRTKPLGLIVTSRLTGRSQKKYNINPW